LTITQDSTIKQYNAAACHYSGSDLSVQELVKSLKLSCKNTEASRLQYLEKTR
jgi:predicted AAA+ superfamily ATPase